MWKWLYFYSKYYSFNCSFFPVDSEFQKKVMYMLVEMNLTIRNIQASIKRIESVSAGTKELPAQAESLEDLHSVEEGLRTVQDREDMVRLNGSLISVLKQGHSWVLITSRFLHILMRYFYILYSLWRVSMRFSQNNWEKSLNSHDTFLF